MYTYIFFLLLGFFYIFAHNFISADEGLFGYLYTAEVIPKGKSELEEYLTLKTGKKKPTAYDAITSKTAIEFGLVDNLQLSLYINSSYQNYSSFADPEDISKVNNLKQFDVDGVSFEFIYVISSPYKNSLGFAIYLEPAIVIRDNITGLAVNERELETRFIFQQNYLDNQLVSVCNIMFEPEWVRDGDHITREMYFEFTYGLSYRFIPNWFMGMEIRSHNEFVDFDIKKQEHSAWFAGLSLHYAVEKFHFTLTVLPQIYGWQNYQVNEINSRSNQDISHNIHNINDSNLVLSQHEKLEMRLRFGVLID